MFKKILSQIGIGAATVDTRLTDDRCEPGGQIHGVVHIKAGNVDQEIDRIYLEFNTQYKQEVNDSTTFTTFTLDRFALNEAKFTIEAGVEREIPFTLRVPLNTPLSVSQSKSWIETGLDIAQAVDPSDRDAVIVEANRYQATVLDAMESLGFRLKKPIRKNYLDDSGKIYRLLRSLSIQLAIHTTPINWMRSKSSCFKTAQGLI